MKWFLILCVLQVALGAMVPEGNGEGITLFYHESVGIKEAGRIKELEDRQKSTRLAGISHASEPGDNPWLGGLLVQLSDGRISVCSSSLISNTKLVTAAHCWFDGRHQGVSITVVLGSSQLFYGGVRLITSDVEIHASFNPLNLNNDIGIITVPWVEYTDIIQPVTVPTGFHLWFTYEGNMALAAGFGVRHEDESITLEQEARQQALEVLDNVDCGQFYGFNIISSTLCTNGIGFVGPCGGDSGGPLVLSPNNEKILIGISSFYSASGCHQGFPGGFARATSFSSWITARM